ncbi:MAG: hypothetical protein MMC23_001275 [Stictis urceolatum]|nr:hypothetical protein [Stictis urceolata]
MEVTMPAEEVPFSCFWLLLLFLVMHAVGLSIYRIWFHPLANFPGPRSAALTKWYEFYYDIVKRPGGTFMFEIERMHREYGKLNSPIVRINPDELHIKDSNWADALYTNPQQDTRDKYGPAAHMTGTPRGIFGTISHEIHRERRAALGPFFSKSSTSAAEAVINEKVGIFIQSLQEQSLRQGYCEMRLNYLAMATDILCNHTFQSSMNLLTNAQKAKNWHATIRAIAILTPLVKQFTWIIPLALKIPLRLLSVVVPDLARIVALRKDMTKQAKAAIGELEDNTSADPKYGGQRQRSHENIFHTLLHSKSLSAEEKEADRIAQEAFVVIVAGGETTARVLTTATFRLLDNRNTALKKLRQELDGVFEAAETTAPLKILEQLPWLTAVIKESLRITALVTSRLPLVSPNEALVYANWVIPPGTPVSMTLRDVLLDPQIFEEPHSFKPERWLQESPDLKRISKGYLPFGRGSRMCIGLK